jgi:hypothetical protein
VEPGRGVHEQADYQGQLNDFEFSTKELIRQADDEDIDGALKSYVAMTKSCVNCHELIAITSDADSCCCRLQ